MRDRDPLRLLFESRGIPARAPFVAAFVEDAFGSDDAVLFSDVFFADFDFVVVFGLHLGIDFLTGAQHERQTRAGGASAQTSRRTLVARWTEADVVRPELITTLSDADGPCWCHESCAGL